MNKRPKVRDKQLWLIYVGFLEKVAHHPPHSSSLRERLKKTKQRKKIYNTKERNSRVLFATLKSKI